jgi:hypothetical protein
MTPTPSSTPSASVTTKPVVPVQPTIAPATVVVGADNLIIKYNGTTQKFPYTQSPANVIAALNKTFGTTPAAVFKAGDNYCVADTTTVNYGDAEILYNYKTLAEAKNWSVFSTKNDRQGVTVTAPTGESVGDLFSKVAAKLPKAQRIDTTYKGVQYGYLVDEQSTVHPTTPENLYNGEQNDANGTVIAAANGVITDISAPAYLHQDC